MQNHIIRLTAILFGMAAFSPGRAQQIIGQYANWFTMVMVLPESHTRVCAMSYIYGAAGGRGVVKQVTFKIYARSERYPDGLSTIELYKESWDMAKDIHPDVLVKIDGQPVRLGESIGGGSRIELMVSPDELAPLMGALAGGKLLLIQFPSQEDADWPIWLSGAKHAAASLMKCARANSAAAPFQQLSCTEIVRTYAFTSRAQFMCDYSLYNQKWIENARRCSGELGDADVKSTVESGMKMFDARVTAHGLKYVCQNVLKSFPDIVGK